MSRTWRFKFSTSFHKLKKKTRVRARDILRCVEIQLNHCSGGLTNHNCQNFLVSQWSWSFGKAPKLNFLRVWGIWRNSVWPLEMKGQKSFMNVPTALCSNFLCCGPWHPQSKEKMVLKSSTKRCELSFALFVFFFSWILNFTFRDLPSPVFWKLPSFDGRLVVSAYFFTFFLPSSTNQS